MNSCESCREQMHRMLDARTEPATTELRAHLAECVYCRTAWEQLRDAESALTLTGDVARAPVGRGNARLRSRIMAAVNQEPRHLQRRNRRAWAWAGAAAVAIVVVGVAVMTLSSRDPHSSRHANTPTAEPGPSAHASLGTVSDLPIPSLNGFNAMTPKDYVPTEFISAQGDYAWLTKAIFSNLGSAARAVSANNADVAPLLREKQGSQLLGKTGAQAT